MWIKSMHTKWISNSSLSQSKFMAANIKRACVEKLLFTRWIHLQYVCVVYSGRRAAGKMQQCLCFGMNVMYSVFGFQCILFLLRIPISFTHTARRIHTPIHRIGSVFFVIVPHRNLFIHFIHSFSRTVHFIAFVVHWKCQKFVSWKDCFSIF